jgi:hypothetical protein
MSSAFGVAGPSPPGPKRLYSWEDAPSRSRCDRKRVVRTRLRHRDCECQVAILTIDGSKFPRAKNGKATIFHIENRQTIP